MKNASFELYKNCPTNHSYESDANIVDNWEYGTYTNVNGAEYYHNLKCPADSEQVMLFLPPTLPLPDGSAFMSIRQYVYRKPGMTEKDIAKVYVGQCLQSALKPGTPYTFSFNAGKFKSNDDRNFKYKSAPFTVAIFGHSDCNAVPFGPAFAYSNGCPENYPGWILLGKTIVHSKGKWVQSRIDFTVPSDINVIEVGPDCSIINPDSDLPDSTTFLDFYVYYLDNLQLLPTTDFHFSHIQTQGGNPCSADSLLKAPNISNASYQWYKDSVAIVGASENSYHLPANNATGNYNVRIVTSDSCLISEPFPLQPNEFYNLQLPADTSFCDNDTLLLAPALNGVHYKLDGSTASTVKIFKEGIYKIVAGDANGCNKNFTVNVHAKSCKIYVPNVFTPNGDGRNDVFRIPQDSKIQMEQFSVFDIWGHKVFNTTNRNDGWDGNFKGKVSPIGTYVYIIKGTVDNKKMQLKGTVTLIR